MTGTPRRRVQLLLWVALGIVVVWSLTFVGRYGLNLPRADEWQDVWVILGDQPLTLQWLWSPHDVHRAPLSRLTRLVLYHAMGSDLRSALFFNVLVMGAAAAAMLRATARCRGAPSLLDVFFPLLLVGPSHFMNFLWGFQVAFVVSSALFVAAIALVASMNGPPRQRDLALLGLCLVLQVLTGLNGVALALPLIVWLAVAFLTVFRGLQKD